MWERTEIGINEPLVSIKIARHEPIEPFKEYPVGVLFVCPIEDFQLLLLQIIDTLVYKFRTKILKRPPLDQLSSPKPIRSQIRSDMRTYS